ncbi:caspase family protein [Burkholderia pseudomultivorans]|uniref:caspase family protein n=1 Tax=Burkholderia pseudomultivorans TaxID=1207504 RepID=UPI000A5043DA|nr:caspase family protein [Burkholderia pseudomultivorans]
MRPGPRSRFDPLRRALLGRASALAVLPWLDGAAAYAALRDAPRAALVIGNAAYPRAMLDNPVNDATAIAAALGGLGFSVDRRLDVGHQSMIDAIGDFCAKVQHTQSVALFYFAGHGMQIDWRNYLLPVDVRLARVDDVIRQSVDVATLLAGLGKANNPMSVVILDACRDNPFGVAGKSGGGLSQMDAPPRTLLAYATAPGNVASDGDGRNGLYTENLLKEIGRAGVQIEDVFKRVRLSVRQRSQGRQIPWESTSLEDDFFFVPPPDVHVPTQAERDAAFGKDRDDWQAAQQVGTAQAIFAYLKSHPSGHFSEIAEATLDRLLAGQGEKPVKVQTSSQNPYSQGSEEAGRITLGDRYVYRFVDRLHQSERIFVHRVTRIDGERIEFNGGKFVTDLLGNPRREADGGVLGDNQLFASEYSIGKEWITRFDYMFPNGNVDVVELTCKVVARETIDVPAGRFDAFRVEASGWRLYAPSRRVRTYWVAPGKVPRFIALDTVNYDRHGVVAASERRELMSFTKT